MSLDAIIVVSDVPQCKVVEDRSLDLQWAILVISIIVESSTMWWYVDRWILEGTVLLKFCLTCDGVVRKAQVTRQGCTTT